MRQDIPLPQYAAKHTVGARKVTDVTFNHVRGLCVIHLAGSDEQVPVSQAWFKNQLGHNSARSLYYVHDAAGRAHMMTEGDFDALYEPVQTA